MWNNLDEFTTWYIDNKHPMRPPASDPVYETKHNSLNMIVYREGRYQVELVIVKPKSTFAEAAEKEGVEQRLIFLSGAITGYSNDKIVYDSSPYADMSAENGTNILFNMVFKPGDATLDKVVIGNKGASFFSVQRWDDNLEMNSLAKYKDILV